MVTILTFKKWDRELGEDQEGGLLFTLYSSDRFEFFHHSLLITF